MHWFYLVSMLHMGVNLSCGNQGAVYNESLRQNLWTEQIVFSLQLISISWNKAKHATDWQYTLQHIAKLKDILRLVIFLHIALSGDNNVLLYLKITTNARATSLMATLNVTVQRQFVARVTLYSVEILCC